MTSLTMTHPRRTRRALLPGLLALATLALGACTTTYDVRLNNQSSEPVYAQIFKSGGASGEKLGSGARIGPGDSAFLRTQPIPTKWAVYVEVDSLGNPGYPARLDLEPGSTVAEVVKEDNAASRSRLLIKQAQRP